MRYQVGTILVHSAHGAMEVVREHSQKFPNGDVRDCITLENTSTPPLTLTVPCDQLAEAGLRTVVSAEGVQTIMEVLKVEVTEEPANWSRRFKQYEEKMRSGSIERVAEIVRDLTRRNAAKPVSPGEKRMLERATNQLASELLHAGAGTSLADVVQLVQTESLRS